jgi:hypothetical protein
MSFTLAQHEFTRIFYVLRDLRAADIVLCFPLLDEKQATLKLGTGRLFSLIDGTIVATQVAHRRPECLLLSSTMVLKLMRLELRDERRNFDGSCEGSLSPIFVGISSCRRCRRSTLRRVTEDVGRRLPMAASTSRLTTCESTFGPSDRHE